MKRSRADRAHIYQLIEEYVTKRLQKRKFNTRPIRLTYNKIAYKLNYKYQKDITYDEVRGCFKIMIENGILEKWRAWEDYNRRANYYRLKKSIETIKR